MKIGDCVVSTICSCMIGKVKSIDDNGNVIVEISGKNILFNENYLRQIKKIGVTL